MASENEFVRKDVYEADQRALMAEIKLGNAEILKKIDQLAIEVNGRIDVLSEKLEHTTDSLTIAILDLDKRIDTMDKRIDDIRQTQNLWFSIFGIIATVVPIAVVVIQSFAK